MNMIHDERSKLYKALALDDAFRKKITEYKMRLSLCGHPIPLGGFLSDAAFDTWSKQLHESLLLKLEKDPDYLSKLKKITKGKPDSLTLDQFFAAEDLKKETLTDLYPYQNPLLEILKQFIKNRELDRFDLDFIKKLVFFDNVSYDPITLSYNGIAHKDYIEFNLRVYPQARFKHLKAIWKEIKKAQIFLRGYKKRFRKSPNLEGGMETATDGAVRTARSRNKRIVAQATVTDKESVS